MLKSALNSIFILMLITCLISGCSDDNENVNSSSSYSTKANEVHSTSKEIDSNDKNQSNEKKVIEDTIYTGKAVDTTIPVSKDEMDKFIPIAKDLKMNEQEVRTMAQVFKQVNIDINKLTDYTITRDIQSSPNGIGGFNDKLLGIKLVNMFDKNEMRAITIYITRLKKGMSIYCNGLGKGVYYLYDDEQIFGSINDFDIESEEVYQKMFDYMKKHPVARAKNIRFMQIHVGTGGATYYEGIEGIKKTGLFSIADDGTIIYNVTPVFEIESEVYGEENKEKTHLYTFTLDGKYYNKQR